MNERVYVQTNMPSGTRSWPSTPLVTGGSRCSTGTRPAGAAPAGRISLPITNFGDGTISSYAVGEGGSIELLEPIAASTRLGEPGVRDEAISRDGRLLYAIDTDAQRVFGWTVGDDGRLTLVGEFEGVPPTVAGLAAS